jgi:hypothetical protein
MCFYVPDDFGRAVARLVYTDESLNIAMFLKSHNDKWAVRFPLTEQGYLHWGLPASEFCQLDTALDLTTTKILIFRDTNFDCRTLIDLDFFAQLEKMSKDNAQSRLLNQGTVIQISAQDATKEIGIEKVRTVLGIQKHELAVFGDDFNDLEMLTGYQTSIAMGNAEQQLKSLAKYTTLDNDNDGFAHAVKNILKLI